MTQMGARFEVYQARDGWRWRLRAGNHRIVAVGEAHPRRRDAFRAAKNLSDVAAQADRREVVILEDR